MKNIHFWPLSLFLNLIAFVGLFQVQTQTASRNPASMNPSIQLEIKSIKVPQISSLKSFRDASLIATFNGTHKVDLLNSRKLSLTAGQSIDLDIKHRINDSLIRNNQLEFKLELVKSGLISQVILRCAQISKKINEYNRVYQCTTPDNPNEAVITYRLSNDSLPAAPQSLAQNR